MKKLIAGLAAFTLFTGMVGTIYAEEATQPVQQTSGALPQSDDLAQLLSVDPAAEQAAEDLLQEEAAGTQSAETLAVLEELQQYPEISKDNVLAVLEKAYKYLQLRDKYYRNILTVIKKIEQTDNKAAKKIAILIFEKRYAAEKEHDRYVHEKLMKVLAFLKANSSEWTAPQKAVLIKAYKPILTKYTTHRKVIIYVHHKFEALKRTYLQEEVDKLMKLAETHRKQGQLDKSLKLYETAAKSGIAGDNAYKELGMLLKNTEGDVAKVFVGGRRTQFEVNPVIKDGNTLVPIRKVAEALSAKVQWQQETRTVEITRGDKKINLVIDSKTVRVNGAEIEIEVPATIINGNTLVPLRVVSENLDAKVGWDGDTKLITIDDKFGSENSEVSVEPAVSSIVDGAVPTLSEQAAVDELLNSK